MKTIPASIERTAKYWVCGPCADEKNWKCVDYAVTCISGLCGHCEREDETTLIPIVDFNGPGKKAIWD